MNNCPKTNEIIADFTTELLKQSKAEAVIQFGSSINGNHWKHSDIDLFVLTNRAKSHSGFYTERAGIVFHGNVIKPNAFFEKFKDPTKLTFHSLFVNSRIIHNKTNWIKAEKARLSKYPKFNRTYHAIERIEAVLYSIYQMKKTNSIHLVPPSALDIPAQALIKVFEIERIHNGIYFGKSLIGKLDPKEAKDFASYLRLPLSKQITLLEEFISPWISIYLPLWLKKIEKQKSKHTFDELSQKLKIDAFHIYAEAKRRHFINLDHVPKRIHGFQLNEWVVTKKR